MALIWFKLRQGDPTLHLRRCFLKVIEYGLHDFHGETVALPLAQHNWRAISVGGALGDATVFF